MQAIQGYDSILRGDVKLIDVRAPCEHAKASPAGAVNLPILDDGERVAVGTSYKQEGPEAARALGHRLVSGEVRARRVAQWIAEIERAEREVAVYCWRGGDRSRLAQAWLREAGFETPRIEGGFRALRRAGIDVVERAAARRRWFVVGGRTGSGKTELLTQLASKVDLEALANHRGSAFGGMAGGQPTQVRFELDLAARLLSLPPDRAVGIEDESVAIGRRTVPAPIVEVIRSAPFVRLEIPLERRIENVHRDYILEPLRAGQSAPAVEAALTSATDRIGKRLGPERHVLVRSAIERAFRGCVTDVEPHRSWIGELLTRYYDPLYDRSIQASRGREVFRGGMADCLEFLQAECACADASAPKVS